MDTSLLQHESCVQGEAQVSAVGDRQWDVKWPPQVGVGDSSSELGNLPLSDLGDRSGICLPS
jgi:hypothetical protein